MADLPVADPPFVVEDSFDDAQWRGLAAKGSQRTVEEQAIYMRGPRKHPYGPLAHRAIVEGADGGREHRIYPTKAHADADTSGKPVRAGK